MNKPSTGIARLLNKDLPKLNQNSAYVMKTELVFNVTMPKR